MKQFSILLLIALLLSQCAHPVTPSGGPKDINAPLLLKTIPEPGSLDTRPLKVSFYFDENIKVSSPGENVVISPIGNFNPKYIHKNKSFSVVFPADSLDNNTTYSINLNSTISDLNEDNKGNYPVYLFSTGPQVDTGKLILRYQELEATKNSYIALAMSTGSRATKYRGTFSADKIRFDGLKPGPYNVYVFNDLNKNLVPDLEENVGHGLRNTAFADSSITYIYGNLARKVDLNVRGVDLLIMNLGHPLLEKLSEDDKISRFNDTLITDSLYFGKIKTLYFNNYIISKSNYKSGLLFNINKSLIRTDTTQKIEISFNQDIVSIDSTKFYVSAENDTTNIVPFEISFFKNIIYITPLVRHKYYRLKIEKNAVTTDFTELGRIIREDIYFNNSGLVHVQNNGNKDLWLKLYNEREYKYVFIPSNSTRTISLEKGSYKGLYYHDENGDNLLTPASIHNNTEAEKFKIISSILSVPNLENTVVIDIDK